MKVTIDIAESGRYPIGKAADALGISRNTLRSYADRGIIRAGVSRINGRLVFKGSELIRLWRTHI